MFAASNAAKQAYKAKLFTYEKDCQFILSYLLHLVVMLYLW